MTVRSRYLLAAALGLCMAHPLVAQEPGPLAAEPGPVLAPQAAPSVNQQVANSIADRLRQSGQLRHYDVDIRFQDGTAELLGAVADQSQRDEVVRLVQSVPGVERVVVDRLAVSGGEIIQVQAAVPPPAPAPSAAAAGTPVDPLPLSAGLQPVAFTEPACCRPPCCPPCCPPPACCNPGMPAGPAYPFPKIPPGWGSVKLQWLDGHWWLGKTATQHDWWRYRYW
jgi:hypothetical protein